MPAPSDMNTPAAQVLIVDDEPDHAEVMAEALKRLGHVCTLVHSLDDAREELRLGSFDLIVTDLVMDGEQDGLEVLASARQLQPSAETIMVTAHGDVPTAKAAIKGGAYDFIEKPLDLDVYRTLCTHAIQAVMLRSQNAELRGRLDEAFGFEGIIGQSPGIRRVITLLRQVATSGIAVLITGESGTGKELVAQAIHNNSKRARKPFVPLNCAGLSESILEDELFGHVRGAFTGADRDREGRFEYADGGTLFLDEVGDMPLAMQAKLLRVLESGEVVRVGSNEPRHVDVRFVSATNRPIAELVKQGRFREDLYFRIRGTEVHLPPLRERREDVPLLVRHFLQRFAKQMDRPVPRLAEDTLRTLMRYDWPGNIRQLMNATQNLLVLTAGEEVETLEPRHLPSELLSAGSLAGPAAPAALIAAGESAESRPSSTPDEAGPSPLPAAAIELPSVPSVSTSAASSAGLSLDRIEKQAIREALRVNNGNREATAKMLGIGERTLYRKLKEYGIK